MPTADSKPLALDTLRLTSSSRRDWHRIIVSLRRSVDLYADLVDRARDTGVLAAHEAATKPIRDEQPIITRPFRDAEIYDPIAQVIGWPFAHPARSRFSAGGYGVWYGAGTLETAMRETAYHFRVNALASAAARASKTIVQERRAHLVECTAAVVDLRPHVKRTPALVDPHDYAYCQALGAQLRAAGQPGVLNRSARHRPGIVVGVFRPELLRNPRVQHYLTYYLEVESGRVRIERARGDVVADIAPKD